MSYGTTLVEHNGSTATFHRNKRAALKGFIYVAGRRVYGRIESGVFVANGAPSQAVAQPA